MPSGQNGLNAGPNFNLFRHVLLPNDSQAAECIIIERLEDLYERGTQLSLATQGQIQHAQIVGAVSNLGRLSKRLEIKGD